MLITLIKFRWTTPPPPPRIDATALLNLYLPFWLPHNEWILCHVIILFIYYVFLTGSVNLLSFTIYGLFNMYGQPISIYVVRLLLLSSGILSWTIDLHLPYCWRSKYFNATLQALVYEYLKFVSDTVCYFPSFAAVD